MSLFGKNIKKIRSVKGMSQQAFAELFDLKRGTLGAYEEGRSEPKIETLIKIANHFSITTDTLLTTEITVNELLKFKGTLTTESKNLKHEQYAVIPCITETNASNYVSQYGNQSFVDELPFIKLPVNPTKTFRAFTVSNLEMTKHDKGFYPKDIVVGEYVPEDVIKKLNNGTLVFSVVGEKIIFRRLYTTKNEAIFRADHKNIEDETYPVKDIKELWRVRYVFWRRIPELHGEFEDKLHMIEQELLQMKKKLG